MSEDNNLRQRIGNRTPYKVPDGFFDGFTSVMMQRIADEEVRRLRRRAVRMRRFVVSAAAAAIVLAFVSVTYYFDKSERQFEARQQSQEKYIDDLCDYAMVDNAEIYNYLAEETN